MITHAPGIGKRDSKVKNEPNKKRKPEEVHCVAFQNDFQGQQFKPSISLLSILALRICTPSPVLPLSCSYTSLSFSLSIYRGTQTSAPLPNSPSKSSLQDKEPGLLYLHVRIMYVSAPLASSPLLQPSAGA